MPECSKTIIKKCAVIDDICGYGKCSLGVSIPILSAAGIEVSNIPTANFNYHTAINGFSYIDTGDFCHEYVDQWRKNNIKFDAIYTGDFINKSQVYAAIQLAADNKNAYKFVDPVLGDFGNFYHNNGRQILPHIKKLCSIADIITPNLTEACLLTNTKFKNAFKFNEIKLLLEKLKELGCRSAILTGVPFDDNNIYNFYISENNKISKHKNKFYDHVIHGAGDVFSACLLSCIIQTANVKEAIEFSSKFVCKCIEYTISQKGFENKGITFEPYLNILTEKSINGWKN